MPIQMAMNAGKIKAITSANSSVHCKKCPYIHGYFVASFPRFNQFRMWAHVLHYCVDLRIETYVEPVPLKYEKLARKYPWMYGYFSQCMMTFLRDLLTIGMIGVLISLQVAVV